MQQIPVIAVVGPTASGKTALAVELARWKQSEIISADSMQVYRQMSIGTARPSPEEQQGVPHHLLGFLDLSETFSVADYVRLARTCILDLHKRGKIPVIVGGTGLYVRSLLENLSFAENDRDSKLREELTEKARIHGEQALVDELSGFDPDSAARIDPHNLPRLIRAIEIYRVTGRTMTQQLADSRKHPSPYHVCMIGLNFSDRQILYQRINQRVDDMLQNGLLEEAREVLAHPSAKTAWQAIGYKEFAPYFAGDVPLEEAVETMKRETRRYAKRQLTWFRRDPAIRWIYPDVCGQENVLPTAMGIVREMLG